jgi:hypothetical protein
MYEEITEVLTQHFFSLTPPSVEAIMEDDLLAKPTRILTPVD